MLSFNRKSKVSRSRYYNDRYGNYKQGWGFSEKTSRSAAKRDYKLSKRSGKSVSWSDDRDW